MLNYIVKNSPNTTKKIVIVYCDNSIKINFSLTNGGLKDERTGLNDKYNANGKIDKQETRQGYARRISENSRGSHKETRTFRGGKTPEKIVSYI